MTSYMDVYLTFCFHYSRLEVCNYSGYKIYPGHGKRFIRLDGKVSPVFILEFRFLRLLLISSLLSVSNMADILKA